MRPVEPMRSAMAPAASAAARPVTPLASSPAPPAVASSMPQTTGSGGGSFAARTLQPLQFSAAPGSMATPLNGSASPTAMPALAPVTTLRPKLGF